MKPSNYTNAPMGSVAQKAEPEWVAQNIMKILARTGDTWRVLSWEEYMEERLKDSATDKGGGFSRYEQKYFDMVIDYCASPESANRFCKDWYKEN